MYAIAFCKVALIIEKVVMKDIATIALFKLSHLIKHHDASLNELGIMLEYSSI